MNLITSKLIKDIKFGVLFYIQFMFKNSIILIIKHKKIN